MIGGSPRVALPGQPIPANSWGQQGPPSQDEPWNPDVVTGTFEDILKNQPHEGGDFRYSVGGEPKQVPYLEIIALLTAGRIEAQQLYDAKELPNVDLVGKMPPGLRDFILSRNLLPPGQYTYRLNWSAQGALYKGGAFDNSFAPFTAENAALAFTGKVINVSDLTSLTYHFANTTALAATYQIYGGANPGQGGALPGLGTGTVPAGTVDLPIGLALNSGTIRYLYASLTFAAAPTSGYVQIIPIARKVA